MIKKKPKQKAGSSAQPEAASPEFDAFKELAGKIIKVPKSEIDKREREYKASRDKN